MNGVLIIGLANLGRVAVHASQMFSSNMANLVGEYWDRGTPVSAELRGRNHQKGA